MLFLHVAFLLCRHIVTRYDDDHLMLFTFSFDEANLADIISQNVRKAKYEKPTPIQKYSIPMIAAGRDIMGCAQTGSGKTVSIPGDAPQARLRTGLMDGFTNHDKTL